MLQFLGDSKSQRASKSHFWFKSYGDFAEWVDFAASAVEGLLLTWPTPSSSSGNIVPIDLHTYCSFR